MVSGYNNKLYAVGTSTGEANKTVLYSRTTRINTISRAETLQSLL